MNEVIEKVVDEPKGNEDGDLKAKLTKEIKEHNITRNSLKILEDLYKKCKSELRDVQEVKKRLAIKFNDLKSVKELALVLEKESCQI